MKYLIEEFHLTDSAAKKALTVWIIETNVKGNFDHSTGIFKKEPVQINDSEVIDVEFEDNPDEILSFCPECGNKLKIDLVNNSNWCENCKTNRT